MRVFCSTAKWPNFCTSSRGLEASGDPGDKLCDAFEPFEREDDLKMGIRV